MMPNLSPDDIDDFKEESTHLIEVINELDLYSYFSRNAIGATFYKIAAVNAVRSGIDLESFLRIGANFHSLVETMIQEKDNKFFSDLEKELPHGDENQKD